MSKKKILDSIKNKVSEVKNLAENGSIEELKKAKNELDELQARYDLSKDVFDEQPIDEASLNKLKESDENSVKDFANAARHHFKNTTIVPNQEGLESSGGYVVPQDIKTEINRYRDAEFSLLKLVDVEKVKTNKGSRTFQKKSQKTGFSKTAEGGKISGKEGPKFEKMSFEIDKYSGYFPVTNELLSDSDQNITNTIIEWIGGESRATDNAEIINLIKSKEVVVLNGLDDIKKQIIVGLGAAYSTTSKIITNDDGLLYLSTLKDKNNNYLLKPNNNDPMKLVLAVGARSVPLEIIGNSVLTSTKKDSKTHIPFIIGDLKEGIKKFDRQAISIVASSIASVTNFNAFEQDMTLFRAITRQDYKIKDKDAFVNCEIIIDDPEVTE